jgi:SAM-dependent methyltransferase
MRKEHLQYLACPNCGNDLDIVRTDHIECGSVESGLLRCLGCANCYEIVRHVPRFVPQQNYSDSFGLEWNLHPRTQYDSYSCTNISERRFFAETKWPLRMEGEAILEVGSGSGRFTEVAAGTGAMVVSLDYSTAVDANHSSNGSKPNVLIVQGDIYSMPFKRNFFDKLFCIGVLQHTPHVEKAFLSLLPYLKPGGRLAIDVYAVNWKLPFKAYYLMRLITRRIPPASLYAFVRRYVTAMWPMVRLIGKLPKGRLLTRVIFSIWDYRGQIPVSEAMLREWAILDTFDALSPRYDKPQFMSNVRRWFRNAGLQDVEVHPGQNGIEGRASKPID